ncbi:MAG: 2-C-methyl-D-erythritol 2,4-cyclodiphosphate synthase [Lachnospiraceae bacterium]|jgi:2-C-methyl-D-erythritol 2,4-cyclodiphosphate synthase|nr:2-C-methyl-D-erythritol 2,4-cyclodiphosphate synthase [Lachnospiraceae bacterium]
MRVGIGYDVHRLTINRKLILGGVDIPYEKGLLGHSDADVLVHAMMDALLGAAALGDIGQHFPDTDETWAGISSLLLLERVGQMLLERGFLIENIDATILAEAPKLSPYIEDMKLLIAKALRVEPEQIGIKATTQEGLGFVGLGEGIAAQAICALTNIYDQSMQGSNSCPRDGCAQCPK